ncbi:hypothetical protein FTUN_7134 [Frigoriglobus tundricola]|uniref:Uncharacterized protein n=1 Tax=Frigoriglobus tundricola TaxID=2774151 RepID=A0A6M5Z2U5_9BACT|nr:hypothetical protein FTUN_7134 [Frigoriglobus tundricola]
MKSPPDRWSAITSKSGEYLNAGVVCVCVVDPETESFGSVSGQRTAAAPYG